MNVAKVFQSGSDRAIQLPDEFRVDADEVSLRRTPEGFLVIPRDPSEIFYEGVEELSDGFFREGHVQPAGRAAGLEAMIYRLDADTLIFMIRGLKSSNRHQASRERAQKLVDCCRQAQAEGDTLAVSAITVAEPEFGARQSDRPDDELRAMRKVLSPFDDRVAFDAVQALAHDGDVRHDLESLGQPIGAMDLLLAAQALSIPATVVTNNTAHFSRVDGLRVENWC